MLAPFLLLLAAIITGCTTPSAPTIPGPRPGAPAATLDADWDDVEAAVRAGIQQAEAAVLSRSSPAPDQRAYAIRTVRGQEGLLLVTRESPAPASPAGPARIRLQASIGRLGIPEAERRLIDAVADRLRQLAGVEYAPIR